MANERWVIERSEVTAAWLSCSVKLVKKCTAWSRLHPSKVAGGGESFTRKNSVQETSVGWQDPQFPATIRHLHGLTERASAQDLLRSILGPLSLCMTRDNSFNTTVLQFPSPWDEVSCWSQRQSNHSCRKERLKVLYQPNSVQGSISFAPVKGMIWGTLPLWAAYLKLPWERS